LLLLLRMHWSECVLHAVWHDHRAGYLEFEREDMRLVYK